MTDEWTEPGEMRRYVIVKLSRTGTAAYTGPACATAGVEPGRVYTNLDKALADAARLSDVNPVGFDVRVESR